MAIVGGVGVFDENKIVVRIIPEGFPEIVTYFEYAYGKPKDVKNVAIENIEIPLFPDIDYDKNR